MNEVGTSSLNLQLQCCKEKSTFWIMYYFPNIRIFPMVYTSTKNVFAQINFLVLKKRRFNVASGVWYVIYENRPSGPKEPSWTSQHETGPRTHGVVKPNVHIFLAADGKCVRFLRRKTTNVSTWTTVLPNQLTDTRLQSCGVPMIPARTGALCDERGLFAAAGAGRGVVISRNKKREHENHNEISLCLCP